MTRRGGMLKYRWHGLPGEAGWQPLTLLKIFFSHFGSRKSHRGHIRFDLRGFFVTFLFRKIKKFREGQWPDARLFDVLCKEFLRGIRLIKRMPGGVFAGAGVIP